MVSFAMAERNWISIRSFPGPVLSNMLKKELENTKLFVVVRMSYWWRTADRLYHQ